MAPLNSVPAVTVRAPAKVNLSLAVGPLRPDGYHELVTCFQAVDLVEQVTVRVADIDGCTVRGRHAEHVPTDAGNLAVRAVRALRDVARERGLPGADTPLAVDIVKSVPVAGGMAGGSADAAAALLAADQLLGLRLTREELHAIAATLGADVPFGLLGLTAIGRGRGDDLTPVLAGDHRLHWVFAVSGQGLSTPAVFRECDRLRGDTPVPDPDVPAGLVAALRGGDPHEIGPLLANDLTDAALSLQPSLADTLAVGRAAGALGAIVSGSGPTTAFLAADREGAIDVAVALTASKVAADVVRATGPAHGARVVEAPLDDTVA